MLQTQAVVSVLTKDLDQLFPASSSMSWSCCEWPSVFTRLYVPDPIPFQPIHHAIAVIAEGGHNYYNDTYFALKMGGENGKNKSPPGCSLLPLVPLKKQIPIVVKEDTWKNE